MVCASEHPAVLYKAGGKLENLMVDLASNKIVTIT